MDRARRGTRRLAYAAFTTKKEKLRLETRGWRLGQISAFGLETFDLDSRDPVLGTHGDGALLGAFDVANARQHVALDLGKFGVRDLAELETHLRFEQLFAQPRVVARLCLGRLDDL